MTDDVAAAPSVLLSAAETLGLIAYGDIRALDGPAPGEPPMHATWGVSETGFGQLRRRSLVFPMRWTLARVRWRLTRSRRRGAWRRCPLPPVAKKARNRIRLLWHQRGRQPMAVLLADLIRDVECAEQAAKAQADALRNASARICAAALTNQLHPIGRPGSRGSGEMATPNHEPIPAAIFAHPHRVVTRDGWATLDSGAVSMTEFVAWREAANPDWGDLRFPAVEAMRLRPPVGAVTASPAGAERALEWMQRAYAVEPRPKRADAIRDCMDAVGVSRAEATKALEQIPNRPTRGRPLGRVGRSQRL